MPRKKWSVFRVYAAFSPSGDWMLRPLDAEDFCKQVPADTRDWFIEVLDRDVARFLSELGDIGDFIRQHGLAPYQPFSFKLLRAWSSRKCRIAVEVKDVIPLIQLTEDQQKERWAYAPKKTT